MIISKNPAKLLRVILLTGFSLSICCVTELAMAAVIAWAQQAQLSSRSAAPAVGAAAVAFDLKTLDGKAIDLQTFRGKPLVMNFFATWCDPCREEMPLINELAAKGSKDGYSVLGIAVEDSRAAVTEFTRESKLVFPIALDLNSVVKRAYRIFGPPATFFIDERGIIRDVVLGPLTPERAPVGLRKVGVVK